MKNVIVFVFVAFMSVLNVSPVTACTYDGECMVGCVGSPRYQCVKQRNSFGTGDGVCICIQNGSPGYGGSQPPNYNIQSPLVVESDERAQMHSMGLAAGRGNASAFGSAVSGLVNGIQQGLAIRAQQQQLQLLESQKKEQEERTRASATRPNAQAYSTNEAQVPRGVNSTPPAQNIIGASKMVRYHEKEQDYVQKLTSWQVLWHDCIKRFADKSKCDKIL